MKGEQCSTSRCSGLKEQNINRVGFPAGDRGNVKGASSKNAQQVDAPSIISCKVLSCVFVQLKITLMPSLNASLYKACARHCNMLQGLAVFSEFGTSCFSHCAPATWNNMQNIGKLMLFLLLERF